MDNNVYNLMIKILELMYIINVKQIGGDDNKYNFAFDKIFGPKSTQN